MVTVDVRPTLSPIQYTVQPNNKAPIGRETNVEQKARQLAIGCKYYVIPQFSIKID